MRIRVIAADSMGVRSIATVVDACGLIVGIDLGAALGPRRYGLPPHPIEKRRLAKAMDDIKKWIRNSHVIVITHYHYDHYIRDEPEVYKKKTLLIKNPVQNINRSQRIRVYKFLRINRVEDLATVKYADSTTFVRENVEIEFSEPVWHGEPGTKLGKVLMLRISCGGDTFVYASDVQGPIDDEALKILKQWRGDIILMDGPPTYFAGYRVSRESVQKGLDNMERLIREVRPRVLIVDHHLVRDLNYRDAISRHLEVARESGVRLVTAAEYMGVREELLEARRRELWRTGGDTIQVDLD